MLKEIPEILTWLMILVKIIRAESICLVCTVFQDTKLDNCMHWKAEQTKHNAT